MTGKCFARREINLSYHTEEDVRVGLAGGKKKQQNKNKVDGVSEDD